MSIENRKGMVSISKDALVYNPKISYLKSVFSNFFPVGSESEMNHQFYDGVRFYGYSPFFRELESGEKIPRYEMNFRMDGEEVVFTGVKEIL